MTVKEFRRYLRKHCRGSDTLMLAHEDPQVMPGYNMSLEPVKVLAYDTDSSSLVLSDSNDKEALTATLDRKKKERRRKQLQG